MTEHDSQLSWTQIIGMLLMGLCVWAVIIGLVYVVVAEHSFPGLVIVVTGLIGIIILNRWLIYINEPKE